MARKPLLATDESVLNLIQRKLNVDTMRGGVLEGGPQKCPKRGKLELEPSRT